MKKLLLIFVFAFISNALWENLHAFLYAGYKGGQITEYILLRASFWDAILVSIILLPFLYLKFLKTKPYLIFIAGVIVAIGIEWYALRTGRWAYNSLMPIIPFLKIGLTPTLQLGSLGYLTYTFQEYVYKNSFLSKSHSSITP
jgi:hypothetical protein